MDPDRWQQVDKLLDEVLEVPPRKRTLFLEQACAGDKELSREVAALLASHEKAGRFVGNHASGKSSSAPSRQSTSIPAEIPGKKTLAEPAAESRIVRFGVFELDLRTGELRKQGIRLRLQEQPFQVLAMLLENPGEMVSREELQKRLWSDDTFVDFDHGLNKAINKIRDALCDSAENPRFVETVARRGYRFIAPVQSNDRLPVLETPGSTAGISSGGLKVLENARLWLGSHLSTHRWLWAAAMLFLAGIAVTATYLWRHRTPPAPNQPIIKSLAVLPLANRSGNPAQDYVSESMTELLISELGQALPVRVISRQTMMQYKDSKKKLPEIARELEVDGILEGSVLREDRQVRFTVQLFHAPTDRHLWARTYQRDFGSLLALQGEIAQMVAQEIRAQINPVQQKRYASPRTIDPDAFELYMNARQVNHFTVESLNKSIGYLKGAIEKDPGFTQAYLALIGTYGSLEQMKNRPNAFLRESNELMKQILKIDPDSAEVRSLLATEQYYNKWDWWGAKREFEHALELNPNLSDIYFNYAWLLNYLGKHRESLRLIRIGHQLDPLNPHMATSVVWRAYIARLYKKALQESERVLRSSPDDYWVNRWARGYIYLAMDQPRKAISELEQARDLTKPSLEALPDLATAYFRAGRKAEAENILNQLLAEEKRNPIPAQLLARLYTGWGDRDRAYSYWEKAYQARDNWVTWIGYSPWLDPIRPDPRYTDLLRRMGLPDASHEIP